MGDDALRDDYLWREDARRDRNAQMLTATRMGLERGMEQGRVEGLLNAIVALMDNGKRTAEEAMQMLKIPEEDYPKYLSML